MKLLIVIAVACLPLSAQGDETAANRTSFVNALVSDSVSQPLTDTTSLSIQNKNLTLEPGIRVTKSGDSLKLSTYDLSRVELFVGTERILLPSPINAKLVDGAWDFGTGKTYGTSEVVARRVQDDTDTNLKSMQESAKKLKTKNNTNQDATQQPGKKLKYRYLFAENPNPTAELFSKQAIQQLTHLSPIGF